MLFWLLILSISATNSVDYSCYDFQFKPRVCLPGPQNVALNNLFTVNSNYTCGSPPTGYCRSAQPSGCSICNASSPTNSHPPRHLTDKDNPFSYWNFGYEPTWWQSITWWDAKQNSLLSNGTLKVKLSLSMGKSYDLTGSFKVTFYSSKPRGFILEKSSDFGKNWIPYRYYADSCSLRFPGVPILKDIDMEAYCEEDSSSQPVQGAQVVFEPAYSHKSFWTKEIQEYLIATDFRISLEYPWTDSTQIISQKSFLNKYYYDITDIQIQGRCHCNGHASYCFRDKNNNERCECRHNTDGVDCEKCLPLFNNKQWKPAEATDKPNPCEECECNNHTESCTYNQTLGFGTCDECRNGTTGNQCQLCKSLYYRNENASISDERTCIECNCFLPGVTNYGSCWNKSSANNGVAGQCLCKPNIHGIRCDECHQGYYGLRINQEGICRACNCSTNGTVNGDFTCHQATGQCPCTNTTDGKTCSICKPGFYSYPTSPSEDCRPCMCDVGGAKTTSCHEKKGSCYCRNGVFGRHCNETMPHRYFPAFDHYIFEAENATGLFNVSSSVSAGQFSSFGFAKLNDGGWIQLSFTPTFLSIYHIVLRYDAMATTHNISVLVTYTNGTVSFMLFSEDVVLKTNSRYMELNQLFVLTESVNYTVRITNKQHSKVFIDSIVFMPDYKSTEIYKQSDIAGQMLLDRCWNQSFEFGGKGAARDQARDRVVFSSTVELFNGTLPCECNAVGSVNNSCKQFGGQCTCKTGVMGRQCHQCMPGYFNFSNNGCQPCECNAIGSINPICSRLTGQCECKENITGRGCGECYRDFFGFGRAQGCQRCGCHVDGSTSPQCLHNGQCVCKQSTEGAKCNACRENYFNLTSSGCSPCECDGRGSTNLQCREDGSCECKSNVHGTKCSSCKQPGFYNLNKMNPSGCLSCFCFNKSFECQSTDGFRLTDILLSADEWLNKNPLALLSNGGRELLLHFTSSIYILTLPSTYNGNRMYLIGQTISITAKIVPNSNATSSNSIKIILRFIDGANNTAEFQINNLPSGISFTQKLTMCTSCERSFIPIWKLQSILAKVVKIELQFESQVGSYGIVYDFKMPQVEKNAVVMISDDSFGGLESCNCPKNFSGSSCERCAKGYTRHHGNMESFDDCLLCSCNNRSTDCHRETGDCFHCRHGSEGKRCERCQLNVMEPDCLKCLHGYYGYGNSDFIGCRACDCVSVNTVNGRSDICDPHTGQCSCKPDIGGRTCDRCAENSVNISHACTECSACHALVQDEFHNISSVLAEFQVLLKNTSTSALVLSNTTFQQLVVKLSKSILSLLAHASASDETEQRLFKEIQDVNNTLDRLESIFMVNISHEVNLLRAQASSVGSYQNKSKEIIDTIYNFMWFSGYVSNVEVQSQIDEMPEKMSNLTKIADYLSEVASKNIFQYMPVLKDVSILFNSSQHFATKSTLLLNSSRQASLVLNETQTRLADLSTAARGTEDLANGLFDQVVQLMNSSVVLLNNVNSTAKEIELITLNDTTKILEELHSRHSSVVNGIQKLNTSYREVRDTYENVFLSTKEFLINSTEILTRVNARSDIVSEIYRNVSRAANMVDNATKIVNVTYETAQKLLFVLNNQQNTIFNATTFLETASRNLTSLNLSSTETLKYLQRTKEETVHILRTATDQLNATRQNNRTLFTQNQGFNQLLNFVKKLADRSTLMNSNFTALSDILRNITNIAANENELVNRCKNITKVAEDAYKRSNASLEQVGQVDRQQKLQQKMLNKIFKTIQNATTFNQSEITTLQNSIQNATDKFNRLNLTHALRILRESNKNQSNSITKYKKTIAELKEEIRAVQELYGSLKSSRGCNDPT